MILGTNKRANKRQSGARRGCERLREDVTFSLFCFNPIFTVGETLGRPRIYHISPRDGSIHGNTQIYIYGTGFSEDQFNYFNSSRGHRVELYNCTTSIECDIVNYFSSSTKITCRTRPASEGEYQVRVYKDGTEISQLGGTYCSGITYICRFRYRSYRTPSVKKVTPSCGPPESIIDIYGSMFTSQYIAQSDEGESRTIIERFQLNGTTCNLTDPETGDLYGIVPISEGNQWVTAKVKTSGKIIGSQNFNYSVVSSNLGLGSSMNLRESLRVSGKNELYHYQTHAVITSVEPTNGSLVGGTLLTIRGNYFANRGYRTPARVSVGGVACVVKNVSDTEIKCVTGKATEHSTNKYPGSRGLIFDKWDTHFSMDDDEWTTTSPVQSKHVIEGSTPLDNITLGDYYCGRLRGYFVPPKDGEYRLAIGGDDVSRLFFSETGDPADMTKVAEGIRYTGWNFARFPEQISNKFNLTADRSYPIEARYIEYGGQDWVQIGYERYDTPFVKTDIEGAINEKQHIVVISDMALEIQSLFVEGAKEVQQVTVAYTGCEESVDCEMLGSFKLTYDGQETAPIAISASAGEVEVELGKLSSLTAIQHSVTAELDGVITRTFNVTFDVYEDLSLMTVSVSDVDNMVASVTEISPGTNITDAEPFAFSYGGKESQALTLGSSALEVQDALLDLFSIKCVQPQQSGLFFSDFENEPTGKLTGKRVMDEEPFCGRTCLKNPTKIYEAGEIRDGANRNPGPISFGMADKMCFAVRGVLAKAAKFTIIYNSGSNTRYSYYWNIFNIEGGFLVSNVWSYRCVNLYDIISLKHSKADDSSFRILRIQLKGNMKDDYFIDNLYIGKSTLDESDWHRQPAANLNGIMVADVHVTKSVSNFTITMTPAKCGHNFPLIGIQGAQMHSGSDNANSNKVKYLKKNSEGAVLFNVERLETASPPVAGYFTLEWNGKQVKVPANADAKKMKNEIERLGTGIVAVVRSGQCSGYTWDVEWTSRG
ncbi:fibrocystin-L-like, partial [Amphiura filiformis]|uniref:fibrocystin-L-like n=1 Tax=Amphiura filiformis TaxID=82378 RepID=UPI003B21F04F